MANETATVAVEETPDATPATEAAPATTEAPATEATEGEATDEPAHTVAASAAEPLDNTLKLNVFTAPQKETVKRLIDQLTGQVKRTEGLRAQIFKLLNEEGNSINEGQEAYFTRYARNLRFIGTQAEVGIKILRGEITVDDDGDAV